MAAQILVPLNRHKRVEEILPYIEEITRPGMRVTFLVPCSAYSWVPLSGYMGAMQTRVRITMAAIRIAERCSVDVQRHLIKQRIISVCACLEKKGLEVAVDTYLGSLRKTLKNYRPSGSIQLIMMQARNFSLLRRTKFFFWTSGPLQRPRFPPVLLLYLGDPV